MAAKVTAQAAVINKEMARSSNNTIASIGTMQKGISSIVQPCFTIIKLKVRMITNKKVRFRRL